MPFADAGTVTVTNFRDGPHLVVAFAWVATAGGIASLNMRVPLEGVLERFACGPTGKSVAGVSVEINFYLYDPFDHDVMEARATAVSDNAQTNALLYASPAAGIALPITLMGYHTFRGTSLTATDYGVFKLYLRT